MIKPKLLIYILFIALTACSQSPVPLPTPVQVTTAVPTASPHLQPSAAITPSPVTEGYNHLQSTVVFTPSPTPQAVTFETADGVTLHGMLYGSGETAVIFSTMGEHHQETWAEMAQKVAEQGYLALTYDFRFWREDGSVNGALRDRAGDDLKAAVAYTQAQGAEHIVLVGASLGGMATLDVADETEPTAVIVLAAPLNETFFPTLHTTVADIQAITAPILFIASEGEDFAIDIQQMYNTAAEPKEMHLYPGEAHGTELFDTLHAADLAERILMFIQTHAPAVSNPAVETTKPVPGIWHDMVYHEQLQQVILVNGGPEEGKSPDDPLELWAWDGVQWTLLNHDGPRWRNFASVAYDSGRDVLVLYGGLQGLSESFEETWEWDGIEWTQHHVSGPGPREAAGMTYDALHHQVVLFGGAQGGELRDDTWVWNGQQWSEVSTQGPSPRFPGGFVYDVAHEKVLLAGGHFIDLTAGEFITFGDTWTWDGSEWSEIAAPGPSPRDGARAVFDAQQGRVVLFGGIQVEGSTATFLSDTWIWDGANWTEVAAAGPPGRGHHAMTYDVARDRVVVFGGSGQAGSLWDDTWEWDGVQWLQRATAVSPSPWGCRLCGGGQS